MKKIGFIFIILFCILFVLKAQYTYNFNRLTMRDGLSSGSITCFLQDRKGFIWIGTSDGLNKYDGYQTYVFKYDPQNADNSIGGNFIRCLYEDTLRNHLWIGLKGGGLSRMDMTTGIITTFRHEDTPNRLSYNDVAGIVHDGEGKLWIAVDRGGLDMFDPNTNTFTNYPLRDQDGQELNNALTGIAMDKHQTIWLTTWGGGVYCFDLKTKIFQVQSQWNTVNNKNNRCKNIYGIYIDKDDIIWISSDDGTYFLHPNDPYLQYAVNQDTEGKNLPIRSTIEDNNGNIWIATTEGVKIFNKKTGKIIHLFLHEDTENGLLSNSINCLYMDNNGTMWIGTSVGVNYYNPLTCQFSWIRKQYNHPLSLSGEEVFSILKDRKNNLWIGSANSIDIIDSSRSSIKKCQLELISKSTTFRNFQAFCETHDGSIWIGNFANFLVKHDPVKKNFSRVDIPSPKGMNLSYRNVYSIYEDWDRSLWLSTEFGAINFNPVTKVFKPLFESDQIIYPEEKTHVIYRDQDLELWVGTEAGLRRYSRDLKIKEIYTSQDKKQSSITNDFVTTIFEDSEGIFWIGTMGGLHRFDKKENKFTLIKRPDVMYGDPVFGLCEDKNGILWISTTSGIIKMNPKNMTFHFYDASDGLQNKDFERRAFYQSEDGELLFGGRGGLNAFYPEKLKTNEQKPPVIITDFQIFNQSVVPGKNAILTRHISETGEIRIKHSQSVISFSFVALNFLSPYKNIYKYQMEGFDHDWILANPGQRSVTYTNLNPGEYVFKVIASNNDGLWNEKPTEMKLTIQPPFRNTIYAYLIYISILCGLIYLVISYFMVREKDKNKIKIAQLEAARIHEIDNMKLNLFTNISHEFRTPLSLISSPLMQLIEKKSYQKEDEELFLLMLRNCQRLTRLIDQLLDFRKIEARKLELNLKYDDIIRFMTDLVASFSYTAKEKNIQYILTTSIRDLWMDFDSDKIEKILYNLISNAFQYTPEKGKIEVGISEIITDNKNYIQIKISDTGIGINDDEKRNIFMAFYQSKRRKSLSNEGSGIGLALVKELIDLHNGRINVESEINKGTVFTVLLPVNEKKRIKETLSEINHASVSDIVKQDELLDIEEAFLSTDVLLIVEDNSDMRQYLETILSKQFKIITSKDGHEGFQKAQEYIPDIIISDIMMPVMDGIELLKAIRKNEKTNHIPIILLTAKHEESLVVEGYKTGADDYIVKPFSEAILKARIENVLSLRRRMWEKYKQSKNIVEYKDQLVENPQKQEFVNKINEIIIRHISEVDFGNEMLAQELRMSFKQLSRKVKALMDTTPGHVIFQVRMTHAAQLLREGNLNISEIAFAVGYEELSNFSRSFKKYYNLSPREYLKNN